MTATITLPGATIPCDPTPGPAIPRSAIHIQDGQFVGVWVGEQDILYSTCDCHLATWPATDLAYRDGPGIYVCDLPRDDNPLPAWFQRQTMR